MKTSFNVLDEENYKAKDSRYENMIYRRTGNSGLLLPSISLGLWHNFSITDDVQNARKILHTAFDNGITHFDLANNYGPPYGGAESNFGDILHKDFKQYRDELIISTKAGYDMWPGPYGDLGSRKYLISSLDQSLKRMNIDYVDIFYHHRPDPNTPLEETMGALDHLVRQGKALYVGLSNYRAEEAAKAFEILAGLGTPCLIHQPRYNMLDRWVEDGLLDTLKRHGVGGIAFSPLRQGVLTSKYLNGFPIDSRAIKDGRYLKKNQINEVLEKVRRLNLIAEERDQTLAQMAIAWLLRDKRITSVLVGASKPSQIVDSLKALNCLKFDALTLTEIDSILKE
jgi:L-glyceraldehyde 3-phosphate reductase